MFNPTGLFALFSVLSSICVVAPKFSFTFESPPRQCENATVLWNEGKPPFHLLLVPVGSIHPEVRLIQEHVLSSNGNRLTFPMIYPGNSKFVAVMSDASGFGTGGTSNIIQVVESKQTNESACFFLKLQVAPKFFFFTDPAEPSRCSPMTISYDARADPPVNIFAITPTLNSSTQIFSGSVSNRSFEWQPEFPEDTKVILVAGDMSGIGKGGSTDILTVRTGNSSCTSTSDVMAQPTSTRSPNSSTSTTMIPWSLSVILAMLSAIPYI